MPCRAKPQFRRGRLPRCVLSMQLLRACGEQSTAALWAELVRVEPRLETSVARNTLLALERRRYIEGVTRSLPNVPGGRQRRWSVTELGHRVLERYERLQVLEQRLAA